MIATRDTAEDLRTATAVLAIGAKYLKAKKLLEDTLLAGVNLDTVEELGNNYVAAHGEFVEAMRRWEASLPKPNTEGVAA